MAFAIYRAPEQFPRAGHAEDESAAWRESRLTVNLTSSDGATPPQPVDRTLRLERPPVVLVHGLFSSSDIWQTQPGFAEKLSSRIPNISLYYADYRYNNTAHFSVNKLVPPAAVITARNDYRNRGLAAVQADIFGHSMGGILNRIWAGDSQYRKDKNYGAGDFNKLITVDSPHTGSPWADLGWFAWNDLEVRSAFETLLGTPTDVGALEDLRTGLDNTALVAMNGQSPDVPGHVIVGNYEPTVDDLADLTCLANTVINQPYIGAFCKAWKVFRFFGYNTSVSLNFPVGSDLVVGAPSQRDGFGSSSSRVSEYSHIHTKFADRPSALETDDVVNRAVELLNTSPDDSRFGYFGNGYSRTTAASATMLSQRLAQPPIRMAAGTGVQITSLANGSTVAPEQTVTVTVQPDTSLALNAMMLISPGDVQELTAAPWQFSVVIPQQAVGPFQIAVVGKDDGGNFYTAEITLNVTPAVELRLLGVTPANVELTEADLQQSLVVQGLYQDDSTRDLTATATGTTYQSSDDSIVTVDAHGLLTAQGNGTTTVTATNGEVSAYVTVRVEVGTDLAISQTDSPDPIGADGLVTYTLTIHNQGTQRALDVQVFNTLPDGATLIDAAGSGWDCNEADGVVNCIRDALDAGANATISLEVEVPLPCGVITNQATVNAITDDGDVDNNISIATTSCMATTSWTLTVAKVGTGSGTITSNSAGIDCGNDCSESYASGTVVNLTATPEADSTFAGWSGGGCSGTGACAVTMGAAQSVTATFTRNSYVLTVRKAGTGGGAVTGTGIDCGNDCSESYASGTVVNLTATPEADSTFAGWSGGGCSSTGACAVMMGAAQSVTATFTRNSYVLTVRKAGTGGGAVTGTGIDCGNDCSESYASGTVVNLTATPEADSTFAGWSGGGCSGTGACAVTMGAAQSVTATFTPVANFSAFSAFSVNPLRINQRLKTLFMLSNFTLGKDSNGIDPVTEPVTLKIADFTTTIPPRSFRKGPAGVYAFAGKINQVSIEALITPLGNKRFGFQAAAYGVSLSVTNNLVTVELTIGDDRGTTSVKPVIIK